VPKVIEGYEVIFFQGDLLSLIGPWLDRIAVSFRNIRATLFIRMPGQLVQL
jgi:hypothetical protein